MRYSFDGGIGNDDSGRGRPLVVRAAAGGGVVVAHAEAAGGAGAAASFPSRCAPSRTHPCPRAILEGTDDPALDPGTRAFYYGATVRLRADQTSGGSNVVQKGYADARSQWKLQVDGLTGRPSCVLVGVGSRRIHLVRSTVSVADGTWHQVTCIRIGAIMTIAVDWVERGRIAVPADLSIGNDAPVRIGGKSPQHGNDQFHGQLDEVVFYLA